MTQFRHILVATDFGEPSQRVTELGLVIARRLGAAFTLVHAGQLLVVARVLLGSVAERVVRLSPVPTIVVP